MCRARSSGVIRTMDDRGGPSRAWHARAHQKLEQVDAAMAQLRGARALLREILDCGCARMSDCAIARRWASEPSGPRRRDRLATRR